jgi:hypothetical protein
LDQLQAHLKSLNIEFIRIDGSTNSKERHVLTQSFQTNINIKAAILGITAAGIALTLTAANVVCFLELYWTPGSLIQAEDRVHRIGQLKNVRIFYFFGIHTIDELLWPLVRKKMQLLGEFVEGTTDQDLNAAVLDSAISTKETSRKASVKDPSDIKTEKAPEQGNSDQKFESTATKEETQVINSVKPTDIKMESKVNKPVTQVVDLAFSPEVKKNQNDEKSKTDDEGKADVSDSESLKKDDGSNVSDPVTKEVFNLEDDEDLMRKQLVIFSMISDKVFILNLFLLYLPF